MRAQLARTGHAWTMDISSTGDAAGSATGKTKSVTPEIMGVVNASLDSLTGGVDADAAAVLAAEMVSAGATILDVGGQSLRTDQGELSVKDELSNSLPVLAAALSAPGNHLVSIDTYRAEVAETAVAHGARLVNDPSGLIDKSMGDLAAAANVDLVLAYSRAIPKVRTNREDLVADPVADCLEFLGSRLDVLETAGVSEERIVIDLGPDLGKSPDQTIKILREAPTIRQKLGGFRFLWALSRKDFVGALVDKSPANRSAGTFGALSSVDFAEGDIVRVHDVGGTADFFGVRQALHDGIEGPLDLDEKVRYEPQSD